MNYICFEFEENNHIFPTMMGSMNVCMERVGFSISNKVKKHCNTKRLCKNNSKVKNIQVFLMANTTERSPAMFDALQVYFPKDASLLNVTSRFGDVWGSLLPSLCHKKVGDGTPVMSHFSFSTSPIFFIKSSDAGELDFISIRKKKSDAIILIGKIVFMTKKWWNVLWSIKTLNHWRYYV